MALKDVPRAAGASGRDLRGRGSIAGLLRTAVGGLRRALYPLTRVQRARDPGARGKQATASQSPAQALQQKSPVPIERLRVGNWIVQGLHDDAVKKAVELRLLAVLEHVVDPTRVCTVADQNSAVPQFNLRPTSAD